MEAIQPLEQLRVKLQFKRGEVALDRLHGGGTAENDIRPSTAVLGVERASTPVASNACETR
jgi:hypothetical protein